MRDRHPRPGAAAADRASAPPAFAGAAGRATRARRRAAAGRRRLALLVAVAGLATGCARVVEDNAALCRRVVPAVEPEGRITILSVIDDPAVRSAIRIDYRVDKAGRERDGFLRCVFAPALLPLADPDLVAVETADDRLGDIRLHILRRFWLGDREIQAGLDGRFATEPTAAGP